jgi:hypothetical protein
MLGPISQSHPPLQICQDWKEPIEKIKKKKTCNISGPLSPSSWKIWDEIYNQSQDITGLMTEATEKSASDPQLHSSFPAAPFSSPPTTAYSDADSLSDPEAAEMDRESSMEPSPGPRTKAGTEGESRRSSEIPSGDAMT